jgi:hypothetical protein
MASSSRVYRLLAKGMEHESIRALISLFSKRRRRKITVLDTALENLKLSFP